MMRNTGDKRNTGVPFLLATAIRLYKLNKNRVYLVSILYQRNAFKTTRRFQATVNSTMRISPLKRTRSRETRDEMERIQILIVNIDRISRSFVQLYDQECQRITNRVAIKNVDSASHQRVPWPTSTMLGTYKLFALVKSRKLGAGRWLNVFRQPTANYGLSPKFLRMSDTGKLSNEGKVSSHRKIRAGRRAVCANCELTSTTFG